MMEVRLAIFTPIEESGSSRLSLPASAQSILGCLLTTRAILASLGEVERTVRALSKHQPWAASPPLSTQHSLLNFSNFMGFGNLHCWGRRRQEEISVVI